MCWFLWCRDCCSRCGCFSSSVRNLTVFPSLKRRAMCLSFWVVEKTVIEEQSLISTTAFCNWCTRLNEWHDVSPVTSQEHLCFPKTAINQCFCTESKYQKYCPLLIQRKIPSFNGCIRYLKHKRGVKYSTSWSACVCPKFPFTSGEAKENYIWLNVEQHVIWRHLSRSDRLNERNPSTCNCCQRWCWSPQMCLTAMTAPTFLANPLVWNTAHRRSGAERAAALRAAEWTKPLV